MLRDDGDDPYLRHAGVMALAGTRDVGALLAAAAADSARVRMGVLLSLRRLESPEVALFLDDPERRRVVEAARAINDVPIGDAMPKLAALIDRPRDSSPLMRRVLNANFRLGTPAHAAKLAAFAARGDAPEPL